ncbi:carbohydrate kinase family protein [Microterricola pindariensis]|uniref:Carbohydrate kinase PfkB domain-containing protein n=1 Tax=Microterricola pindariensis TaxID=478010 RepID=A0ABX5AZA0_9MICO|nr:carbohydrate kinase family protein [Microterricola pindariensis]PPL20227.1 hypothetical protein GY24_01390 [Microterricola pindariensis]
MSAIVCFGVHILDTIAAPIDEVPKLQNSVRVERILHAVGGTAAGVAMDLVHLGSSAATIGVVGDDPTGQFLLGLMRAKGVDVDAVRTLTGAQSSSSVLLIDSLGNRPALHVRGVHEVAEWDDLDLAPLANADFVHVGGLDALSALGRTEVVTMLRTLRARGTFVSLDFQSSAQHLTPELLELVGEVDAFLPNDEQAAGLTGLTAIDEIAHALLLTGVRQVIITCGAEGIYFADRSQTFKVDAFPATVRDTTGCGDSVVAAYLSALSRGYSLRDALTLASAAGAAVASGIGSLGELPSWDGLCLQAGVLTNTASDRTEGVK